MADEQNREDFRAIRDILEEHSRSLGRLEAGLGPLAARLAALEASEAEQTLQLAAHTTSLNRIKAAATCLTSGSGLAAIAGYLWQLFHGGGTPPPTPPFSP